MLIIVLQEWLNKDKYYNPQKTNPSITIPNIVSKFVYILLPICCIHLDCELSRKEVIS